MRVRAQFKKFIALTFREKMLFLEAFYYQMTTGLLLKVIPFRLIPRLFKNKEQVPDRSGARRRQTKHPIQQILIHIKTAIQRSGSYSPWKNKCLVSSLAARRMLNRRKILSQVSLGVAKGEDGRVIAHAWLKSDGFEIVEKGGDFTELYLF